MLKAIVSVHDQPSSTLRNEILANSPIVIAANWIYMEAVPEQRHYGASRKNVFYQNTVCGLSFQRMDDQQ